MRENLTSGLTRGAGASLPLLYLFRLAAGKLHANYGTPLKRLLCGLLGLETRLWILSWTDWFHFDLIFLESLVMAR
jgi:hypothetical protein